MTFENLTMTTEAPPQSVILSLSKDPEQVILSSASSMRLSKGEGRNSEARAYVKHFGGMNHK